MSEDVIPVDQTNDGTFFSVDRHILFSEPSSPPMWISKNKKRGSWHERTHGRNVLRESSRSTAEEGMTN